MFANKVNTGSKNYSGKYVRLDADIAVSTKVGTVSGSSQQNAFCGTFDGGGHTITATITDTDNQGTALFAYINGATIKNLTVAGSFSGTQHAAAIVGFSKGTCSIQNCKATATIGGGTHIGGIVGHALDSNISLSGCVFSGTLTDGGTARGALVGWGDSGTRTLSDCLYVMADGQNTIGLDLVKGSGSVSVSGCYKTTSAGTYGTQVYTAAAAGEISRQMTLQDGNTYYVTCTVGGVKAKYRYTGSPITITPTVAFIGETLAAGTDYTVSTDPAPVQALGDYTLNVTGRGDYTGTKSFSLTVIENVTLTSDMTTLEDLVFVVNEDLTISSRIQISGDVVLVLSEGTTLTAPKGIELSAGNSLTIEGPGALTVNGCDDYKSGIGAAKVGTLTVNGGTINVKGGTRAAGIGGDRNNTGGGTITINAGVVNATGGNAGAGIGGGSDTNAGPYSNCGDIIINGGQVTAIGGWDAAGIGPGVEVTEETYAHYNSGTLTLGWTTLDDFVYISGLRNSSGSTLNSITFADNKAFVFDGNETVVTTSNIAGGKLVPYYHDGNYVLTDDVNYDIIMPLNTTSATYRKTVSDDQRRAWLVPFDYTLTSDDLEKFTFWKINMIANAPNPEADATEEMWVFLKRMQAGDVLHANMPYVYRAEVEVTDYAFTTTDAVLKAKADGVIAKSETLEDVYSFYASYGPTTATAEAPFYYVGNGAVCYGDNVTLGAFRWYIRKTSKYGTGSSAAYARRMYFYDEESGEVTGISSLTPDPSPKGEGSIYTLDGRKLNAMPTQRGIYVVNGKKVVIK